MTTATKKANATRSIILPPEIWKPIAQWLDTFLHRERRIPHDHLPLIQLQAIADQSRRHGLRSKRPLKLTMPNDSWSTLAHRIRDWTDNPPTLVRACAPHPAQALSALMELIDAENQDAA